MAYGNWGALVRLDARTLAELARPFTPAAIKFKVQSVNHEKTKGLASWYIDARLAAERLNEVVGVDNWTDEYRVLASGIEGAGMFFPVECRLTVCGVTKVDVGQYAHNAPDDKAFKSAYSDALKRAAVKFRIGAYLYTLPSLWAEVRVGGNGKVQGFTRDAEAQLRGQYERWLKTPANKYGEPFDHGDVVGEADAGVSPTAGASSGEQGGGAASSPPAAAAAQLLAGDVAIHFGRNNGVRLRALTRNQLRWYAEEWTPDPERESEQDRALKAAAVAFKADENAVMPAEPELPF